MSLAVGVPLLECMYLAGCIRWAWKRCVYVGAFDSATWSKATYEDFARVPQICRVILAVYEEDLTKPVWAPPGGYRMKLENVVKKVDYDVTEGYAPPYLIYVDHDESEIILAIRGLNLGMNKDYQTLLDNRLGRQMFDGGYVHNGLLKSAAWLLTHEAATLMELLEKYPTYTLIFAGHSLGSGVAALMALVVAKNREALGKIPRDRLKCFAMAPARCMSLNLAIQYADMIHSVILQDDFLPRTATPLEDIFSAILCLPCMMTWRCCIDTCTSEKKKLKDPRRLYAPGRMYHIVERRLCRCGTYPPEVRTSVPVEGRFDHVVLSCNATSDHSIVKIEKESERALELLQETVTDIPVEQKMERSESRARDMKSDHKAALERAVTLRVPFAFDPDESNEDNEGSDVRASVVDGQGNYSGAQAAGGQSSMNDRNRVSRSSSNWFDLAERLFSKSNLEDYPATTEQPDQSDENFQRRNLPSGRRWTK